MTAILVVIAMGTLTWKGATAKEALGSETIGLVPEWADKQGFAANADAVAGANLFAESGCLNCHTYLGTGSSNLGAPDLSAEGAKGRGDPVADRPPDEPEQQDARLADAVLRCARRGQPEAARDVPRSFQGRAEVARRAGCPAASGRRALRR